MTRQTLAALFPLLLAASAVAATARPASLDVSSPDGQIVATFRLDENGASHYAVGRAGRPVLLDAPLGLVRDDADFTTGLTLADASDPQKVSDHYEILTAKRRVNDYRATRRTFGLTDADGRRMEIIFQVSDDGVAFRYRFPGDGGPVHRISEERTTYRFAPESRAWLQPMSAAKTGWARTFPSYEEHYSQDVVVGTESPTGAGWVYPALFRSGEDWVLVSEASLSRGYCATRLVNASADGAYRVGFPDPREIFPGGPVNPESTLPWQTPWRLAVIGSLKTVAESMLGVDLAAPALAPPGPEVQPGKASWSWVLLKDDQTTFDVQKRFIDYAADMGWRYCLVDALWDVQIGYDKVKELVDYAAGKNVKIIVWYNSAGPWNDAPQTPRNMMLTHESRITEFKRLKAMGVAGLKVDFFGGDGQSMIDYYFDILDDAAPFGFLMNFHGATVPRGLQRTYPHLMTVEAIRGEEFITFN